MKCGELEGCGKEGKRGCGEGRDRGEELLRVSRRKGGDGEVVEERLQLGRWGEDRTCAKEVESVLDTGDVLEAPAELEEEDEVVRQRRLVDLVRREW